MRNITKVLIALLATTTVSACTPLQLDVWRNMTGKTFTPQETKDYLALPDTPIRVGDKLIHNDGSVTTIIRYIHRDPNVDRWFIPSLDAGWQVSEWKWLSCVIYRESRGIPRAFAHDSNDRSYGLMQINAKSWHRAMVSFAGSESAFFTPSVNLRFARQMYESSGRSPWRAQRNSC